MEYLDSLPPRPSPVFCQDELCRQGEVTAHPCYCKHPSGRAVVQDVAGSLWLIGVLLTGTSMVASLPPLSPGPQEWGEEEHGPEMGASRGGSWVLDFLENGQWDGEQGEQ